MQNTDKIIEELVAIKKLLMLQLMRDDVDASVIGKVLELTPTRIRQIIPVKDVRK